MSKKIFTLGLILFFCACDLLRVGSNAYSEDYLFELGNKDLIRSIEHFKIQNPDYKVYQVNEQDSVYEPGGYYETRIGDTSLHYDEFNTKASSFDVYFYFSDTGATIYCTINLSNPQRTNNKSILSLVGLTYSKNFASWKTINTEDLSEEENEKIKALFEKRILNKLGTWSRR